MLALLTDADEGRGAEQPAKSRRRASSVPTKSVRNTPAGFKALLAWLRRHGAAPQTTHACLEASGGFEEAAALFLVEAGLSVSVLNPRQVKAYAESQLQRSKSDQADARLLARFCQRERPRLWSPPPPEEREVRRLTRLRETLKKERERTRNRLDYQPPGPAREALEAVLTTLKEQIARLDGEIKARLKCEAVLTKGYALLRTIPGVGHVTATIVLSELGAQPRFATARAAAAYAGLVPRHHTSGTSVNKPARLSKLGNGRLRRVLYLPAMAALRHNPAVRALGKRLEERGKKPMAIVGAAMRKLLQLCYGVLVSGRPWDPSMHPTA